MPSTIGDEDTHEELVTALLELEHDMLAAYDVAIERLEREALVAEMRLFRIDHDRRIAQLGDVAASLGLKIPDGSFESVLTSGKIVLAGLAGDKAILHAMGMNEAYASSAYERALGSTCVSEATLAASREALVDARRYREWISRTGDTLGDAS